MVFAGALTSPTMSGRGKGGAVSGRSQKDHRLLRLYYGERKALTSLPEEYMVIYIILIAV